MRVTNAMIVGQAMYDLEVLRRRYSTAQSSVNGRGLERPSDDPQRVAEAMDLSGMKLRLERAQRSGEDAKEWMLITENSLSAMVDRLQYAREIAVQTGGSAGLDALSREGLAKSVEALRDSLMREMNGRHRDQYLFAGWNTGVKPFEDEAAGGVTYTGNGGEILRDIAPGLSIQVNASGQDLLAAGDFMKSLTEMAADLRAGRTGTVTTDRLSEIDRSLSHLTDLRSSLGIRQEQVIQYERYSVEALLKIQDRLGDIGGVDIEDAVLNMVQSQNAYQAALAAFAKSIPQSLVDYMLR